MRMLSMMLAVVLLLSGCADTFTHKKVEQSLIKGVTTKQEVLAVFGKPYGKYTNPGMKATVGGKEQQLLRGSFEVWLYSPHTVRIEDFVEEETLRIIFNEAGIVTNYDYKDDGD